MGNGLELIATSRPQIDAASGQLATWAAGMVQQCDAERVEEEENLAIAKKRKWSMAPFRRKVNELRKRIVFFEKIKLAAEAGYVVIPNLPMNLFAIRVHDEARPQGSARVRWGTPNFEQPAEVLPAGEGEYRNPDPHSYSVERKDSEGHTVHDHYTGNWKDLAFPVTVAKPALMSEVGEAMQRKIFDEIGIVENFERGKKADPILVGRILNPHRSKPDISFFLGWYFDPNRL